MESNDAQEMINITHAEGEKAKNSESPHAAESLLPQTFNSPATDAPVSFDVNSEVQQTVECVEESAQTASASDRTTLKSDHSQPSIVSFEKML